MLRTNIIFMLVLVGQTMNSAHAHVDQNTLLIADPKILAIPIQENHEALIDLRDQNIIAFGPSPEIPDNTDYTKMRKSVYDKLVAAQATLPNGYKFRIYEALRSIPLQERLFQDRYQKVKQLNPTWNHAQIFEETTRLVSPVTNLDGTRNVPPHSTGAAIDIYLIDANNQLVDMGIRTEDWILDTDGSLSVTDSIKISVEAQRNRAIMNKALSDVGFINYKTEYWHWSYGDRYWAYYQQQPFALYGSIG